VVAAEVPVVGAVVVAGAGGERGCGEAWRGGDERERGEAGLGGCGVGRRGAGWRCGERRRCGEEVELVRSDGGIRKEMARARANIKFIAFDKCPRSGTRQRFF
jgi:hypothetical protein